jgi:thioredoxin reductase
MYDVIIIGSGPAGITAALYAIKNKLNALVLSKSFGSYLQSETDIFKVVEIHKFFELGIKEGKIDFQNNQEVINLEKNIVSFSVECKGGKTFYSKTIIIAIGEGETEFDLLTHKDAQGKIKVDSVMSTNISGIFAAGEVLSMSGKDFLINSAQGAQAVLSAVKFLHQNQR